MADPQDMILPLLREIRSEIKDLGRSTERQFEGVNARLERMEERLEIIEKRLIALESRS